MKSIRCFTIYIMLITFSIAYDASAGQKQLIQETGTASISVQLGFFSFKPSPEDMQSAINKAKQNLWRNYSATFPVARLRLMKSKQHDIDDRLDDFLSDFIVTDSVFDKQGNVLRVAVRANINEALVNSYFSEPSGENALKAENPDALKNKKGGSDYVFIFLARQLDTFSGSKGSQASEYKSSESSYKIYNTQDFDTSVSDTLNSAGIEFETYEHMSGRCRAPHPDNLRAEFAKNDELSPETQNGIYLATRECEKRYALIGTLDLDRIVVDPVTGKYKASVSLRARISDLKSDSIQSVISVAPIQYFGLSDIEGVATRNALQRAANAIANEIIDQMSVKGMR